MNRLVLAPPDRQARPRDQLVVLVAATVGYALVAAACIVLTRVGGEIAQIWLPNALAVYAIAKVAPGCRRAILGGSALGGMAANLAFGFEALEIVALAVGNLLEIVLAGAAIRLAQGGISRHSPQRLALAWVLGAIGAPAIAALIAAAGLAWTGTAVFSATYGPWLITDAFALALVLPWLLRASPAASEWRPKVIAEFAVLFALSLAASAGSVRFLGWPFIAASLFPIFTAARLPLAPQVVLAATNGFVLIALINAGAVGASHLLAEGASHVTASVLVAFLPSIFIASVFDAMRQQAQALAGEEARWRSVMQTSPIGMALLAPDGNLVEVNGALANMLGYTPAELLSRPMRDLADPLDAQAAQQAEAAVARSAQDVVRVQMRYRRKDGGTVTAIVAISALRGSDGKTRALLEQVEDITERLHSARVLAEARERERAEARFRAAVEVAPTAMVIVDRQGVVTLVNAQVERAFGWNRTELIGRSIEVLIPGRFRSAHATFRRAFLAAPQTRRMGHGRDLYALRKDGSEFPVEVGLAAFETGEGPFVLAAVVDITERKRGEQDMLRAKANLEEFAYIVSHDLRTPLRAIDNLVEWIADDLGATPPPDVARNLERLRLRVRRLENMIQDLFVYSRVGHGQAARETIVLEDLVHHLVEDLGVSDTFSVELHNAAGTLVASRTPLETVLRNLIGNAVKHHDRPCGRVVIDVRREGGFCVFDVTDDGPGIAAQDQARIFKLFQTLAPATGDHIGGIGLALVKKWVEACAGSVAVASPVVGGRGSRFTVHWPDDGVQVGAGAGQG